MEWGVGQIPIVAGGDIVLPPPPPDAVLLYDTRLWDGGALLLNEGTAGHDYDIPVIDFAGDVKAELSTSGSGIITWADFGGLPSAAPFSMIFVLGANINVAHSSACEIGFWSTNIVYIDAWSTDDATTSTNFSIYTDGVGDAGPIADPSLTPDNLACWVIEIDPSAMTSAIYRNNVLRASSSGPSIAAAADVDLTTNADGIYFFCGHTASTTTPGNVWDGMTGMGMTRSLLSSAERLAWAAYFA